MSEPEGKPAAGTFGDLAHNWAWLLALGLMFIAMGVTGLAMVSELTPASVIVFGIMLLVGGSAQIVTAFRCRGWGSILWHIAIAVLYLLAGIAIIVDPMGSTFVSPYALALILIAIGVARAIIAFRQKGTGGWGWPLITGSLTALLGVMIVARWPHSGFWFIGLAVAVDLIAHGWSTLWIALAARQAGQHARQEAAS